MKGLRCTKQNRIKSTFGINGVSPLAGAVSANYAIDTKKPEVLIESDDIALRAGDIAELKFNFSEKVDGFTSSDISLEDSLGNPLDNNVVLSEFEGPIPNVDGTVSYSVNFTPSPGVDEDEITVNVLSYSDQNGNSGEDASPIKLKIDTLIPTVTSIDLVNDQDSTSTTFAIGDTGTLNVEFSEAIDPGTVNLDDFASGAGVLSNGTFDESATKYSATFTPKISIEAEGQVITLGSNWKDLAGNSADVPADTSNYDVDTLQPKATLKTSDEFLLLGETAEMN